MQGNNLFSLHLISSSLSLLTYIFNINYIYSLLFLIQLLIHPSMSQTTTEDGQEDDPNDGQYTSIYLTMIIIFSVLFVVVIFCLIYRIYKKRQEENIDSDSNKQSSKNGKTSTENGLNEGRMTSTNDGNGVLPEQVKFRGSMSSVENRHERVPSKPVVISITTPKGTRHVADAFGEYDGKDPDQKDSELPEIDEDEEEEYIENQNQNNNNNNNTNNNDQDHGGTESVDT